MMTKYEFLVGEIECLRENPTDECVEWEGARLPQGYGLLTHNGTSSIYVHRLAYQLYYGLYGLELKHPMVLHHCDNPSCYNPRHLYNGTASDNTRDMYRRHRNLRCPWEPGAPTSRISVEVTDEKLIEITVKAARLRLSKAEVARRLLDKWLRGEVEVTGLARARHR